MTGQILDKETVRHIAELSRLELTEEELERFTHQLEEIVDYAGVVLVHDISEKSTDLADANLRVDKDVAVEQENPLNLLRNAQEIRDNSVKVPAILEKE